MVSVLECWFDSQLLFLVLFFFFLFHSDIVDSPGRKYLNEKNFEVEICLRTVLMRYVS